MGNIETTNDNPSCPGCGHYNAILAGACRDCGYVMTPVASCAGEVSIVLRRDQATLLATLLGELTMSQLSPESAVLVYSLHRALARKSSTTINATALGDKVEKL